LIDFGENLHSNILNQYIYNQVSNHEVEDHFTRQYCQAECKTMMSLEKIMIFRVRVSTEPPKQAISLCRPNPRETGTDVRLRKKGGKRRESETGVVFILPLPLRRKGKSKSVVRGRDAFETPFPHASCSPTQANQTTASTLAMQAVHVVAEGEIYEEGQSP
jgi:hypothetical protein